MKFSEASFNDRTIWLLSIPVLYFVYFLAFAASAVFFGLYFSATFRTVSMGVGASLVLAAIPLWFHFKVPKTASREKIDVGFAACALLFSAAIGFLASSINLPNIDDAVYATKAVFYLENPDQQLNKAINWIVGLPTTTEVPAFQYYETIQAAIAYRFGLPYLDLYHVIFPAIVGFQMSLCTLLALSVFEQRRWTLAFGLLLLTLVTMLLGETVRTFGNFSIARAFQGKIFFVAAGLPLWLYLSLRFFVLRRLGTWVALLATGVCLLATTNSAMVLLPLFSAVIFASYVLNGGAIFSRSNVKLGLTYVSALAPVAAAAWEFHSIAQRSLSTRSLISTGFPLTFQGQLDLFINPEHPLTPILFCTAFIVVLLCSAHRRFFAIWVVVMFPANANSVTIPTTAHVRTRLGGGSLYGPLEAAAVDAAEYARAFHWPLAFPEVMIARGGFDVVLGNPPWERIKLQEQEFFAIREPEIAQAPNAAARGKLIQRLADAEPGSSARLLHNQFELAKRVAEASSVFFAAPRDEDPTKIDPAKVGKARRYPWTGRGDVNTYALFAEHFLGLTSPTGWAGLIVPTGIATDAMTAPFFGHLVEEQRLGALFSFENEELIFPGIHHAMKFCLLVLKEKSIKRANFVFFARQVDQLGDPRRRFSLSPSDIAQINPNTKTAPIFRAQADAELTAKIYSRVPVLIDEAKGAAGNPWMMSFMAMFHMASDSSLFQTEAQLREGGYIRQSADWVQERGAQPAQAVIALVGGRDTNHLDLSTGAMRAQEHFVPLYEAKMINFFDHRFGSYGQRGADRGFRVLPETTLAEYQDPTFEPLPYYWVSAIEVERRVPPHWRSHWLLSFKDVTATTNERTAIFSVIPLVGVGHTLPIAMIRRPELAPLLLANLNALVVDYEARTKVGGLHLTYTYLKQFPILPPTAYSDADRAFIAPKVLELTFTSHSMAPFARDLGFNGAPFAWDKERRAHLRADLDAWYALAYGLSRDELRYVLDPKEVMGADYPSETFRVLQKNEIAKYGEYRTARLVMAAYDRLVSEGMRPRIEGYR